MQIQNVSFKSEFPSQEKKAAISAAALSVEKKDTITISNKEQKPKKTALEKISLGFLALSVATGALLLISKKKSPAKTLLQMTEKPHTPPPLSGIKDDTLEQAKQCADDMFQSLWHKNKNIEEILALKKYASEKKHFIEFAEALHRKFTIKDSPKIIEEFEPIINNYFKDNKLEFNQHGHIEDLAYAYNHEKMPEKAYDLLLKAKEKWGGESFSKQSFQKELINLYTDNGLHKEAAKEWEEFFSTPQKNRLSYHTEVTSAIKSYQALGDSENIIKVFRNCSDFDKPEAADIYVATMLKQGQEQPLLNELLNRRWSNPVTNIELIGRNIDKFSINDENKKVINIMSKSLEAEGKVPYWMNEFDKEAQESVQTIKECTKALKGTALPEEYADNMISVLDEILNAEKVKSNAEVLRKIRDFQFKSVDEKYPAYQWLKKNLCPQTIDEA